jgi:hypothetical protein
LFAPISDDRDQIQQTRAGIRAMTDRPNSYDYDALLACSRGELFGPGNAQLPAPPMLMEI